MPDLVKWLDDHDLDNPHKVPPELKEEFYSNFPKDKVKILWPQPGGQEQFSNCDADICIYGGEAGGGKSFNLVLEHLKWKDNPLYKGVLVRKTYQQIFDSGGLWDEANNIFNAVGGRGVKAPRPKYTFPSGAQVIFKQSQHEDHLESYWQGAQASLICVDELTQFSEKEFLYILSRTRSVSGIRPYVRATCNPDPYSWVKSFIGWWIGEDGKIIQERSGKKRWFIRVNDKFIFADTRKELIEKHPKKKPMSLTFIRGSLDENVKLFEEDPDYRAKLEMLPEEKRVALSEGNWNEIKDPTKLFQKMTVNKYRVEPEEVLSSDMERIVIGVDPAGTDNIQNDMVGIVWGGIRQDDEGQMHAYVFKDVSGHYKPDKWSEEICREYHVNFADKVAAEKNYGGDMVETIIRSSDENINVEMVNSSRGKWLRAEPVAGLYNRGLVHHVGHDLEELEAEMYQFEKKNRKSPNRVDALVFALTDLMLDNNARIPNIRTLV